MKNIVALIVFVAALVLVGGAIGAATAPGNWYGSLVKPAFNPPNWIFAPVWTLLYVMIGIAGWLIWRAAPLSRAMLFWGLQLILNWVWSPVFFALHAIQLAAIVIIALLLSIVVFMMEARKVDIRACWLFIPYALWVAFATALNVALAYLN